MILPILAVLAGLLVLIWSADRFVDGASTTAYTLGMPPLLVGMVIVGFGTSAPEIVVSVLASIQHNPGLAFGNAIGSNISNIALILGITAIIAPIAVQSNIIRRELPILSAMTAILVFVVLDKTLSRTDGVLLLVSFVLVMGWSIYTATKKKQDPLNDEFDENLSESGKSLKQGIFWVIAGMLLLVASSRILVWGAVEIATALGVSDLIVGLTVVAIGTSLPELASSIAATRKGEHDIAIGNVIGSNLFNTLCVVGLASTIDPFHLGREVLVRDLPVLCGLTLVLFITCIGFRGKGKITRWEGGVFTLIYVAYTVWIIVGVMKTVGTTGASV